MENLIKSFVGKTVEVYCGSASVFSGKLILVEAGVLSLEDDDGVKTFVDSGRVLAIRERQELSLRPGFIG